VGTDIKYWALWFRSRRSISMKPYTTSKVVDGRFEKTNLWAI